jgi:glucose/arabinose dehydrogenase
LNHGIQLTKDNKKLFASSQAEVYSWEYDAQAAKTTSRQSTWVTGMTNKFSHHPTRTLLMSGKKPNMLLVSRGSQDNLDTTAQKKENGISQIRAFDISGTPKSQPYNTGEVVGWGLRNSVGMDEHPITGGKFELASKSVCHCANVEKAFGATKMALMIFVADLVTQQIFMRPHLEKRLISTDI